MQLTNTMSLAIALASFVALGTVKDAHADEDETRLSVFGVGSLDEIAAFEGNSSTQTYGGGLAVAQGIRDWLDVGVVAGYRLRPDVVVDGAVLNGLGAGEQYQLYTDLQVFETAITARSYLEVGNLLRMRPLVGLRAGVQVARYADPELFFQGQSSVASAGTEWNFSWLAGVEAGIAYRLTDSFEMAWLVSGQRSDSQESLLLALEFSWLRG